MTPTKYRAALDSINTVARKVFDHVPIKDSWPINRIIAEMVSAGVTRVDLRTAEGCIARLKDAGLVKETERGLFQRITPRERETITLPDVAAPAAEADVAVIEATPTLVLGGLAARLRMRAVELNEIANEIDAAALGVEERVEASEQRFAKLREFSAFLKDI